MTGKRLEESETHQRTKHEAEVSVWGCACMHNLMYSPQSQATLHEQKLDYVISELDRCVAVLEVSKLTAGGFPN